MSEREAPFQTNTVVKVRRKTAKIQKEVLKIVRTGVQ